MAKHTLLRMTQFILSSMDSDEVETITETIESQQVVDIIEETYEEILDRRTWEFTKHRPRQLDDGVSYPVTQVDVPSDVVKVEEVRYKNFDNGNFEVIEYLSPQNFLIETKNRDTSQSNIESVTLNDGVTTGVFNDRAPKYYTSFDEDTIVFDAYDVGNEAAITGANSAILATIKPTFTQSDAFIATLPERMFTLFLHESKSTCWLQLKQEGNPKSEQIARRQYTKLKNLEARVEKDEEVQDLGRKAAKYTFTHLPQNR